MMTSVELRVGALRCSGCAMGLRLGFVALAGVSHVDVHVRDGRVVVHGESLDEGQLRAQLRWLGYEPDSR